jgi:aryl-alcohol dehydrogenase-like predicted oxidoreductase
MAKNYKKIILGTAQLGMNYGFCRNGLYKSKKNLKKILNYAYKNNIGYLDTARSYKFSEKNIGEFHKENKINKQFKIITKLSSLSKIKKKNLKNKLLKDISLSLFFLKKKKIDIILIHNFKDLQKHKLHLLKYLNEMKKKKLIKEIGVSVYKPNEALECLKFKNIKHIQIPFNILDQRWTKKIFLNKVKLREDVKIHVRSIFLRGLLINELKYWPKWFKKRSNAIENLEFFKKKFKMINKIELCLAYVKSFNWVNYIVIGVNSLEQLKDTIKLKRKRKLTYSQRLLVISKMKNIADNRIILPYKW